MNNYVKAMKQSTRSTVLYIGVIILFIAGRIVFSLWRDNPNEEAIKHMAKQVCHQNRATREANEKALEELKDGLYGPRRKIRS